MKGLHAALAASFCAAPLALAGAADSRSFEMMAYTNWPGGAEIESGDYEAAIAAAQAHLRNDDRTIALVAATNLCVALTVTGELTDAVAPCDMAVTLAKRVERETIRGYVSREEHSRALSNRGVLRAVSGDALAAAADFRAASGMRGAAAAAHRNLAHLEGSGPSPSESLAARGPE